MSTTDRRTVLAAWRVQLTRTDGPPLTLDYASYAIASHWLTCHAHPPLPMDGDLSRVDQNVTRAAAIELENLCVRLHEQAAAENAEHVLPDNDPLLDLLDFLMACTDGFRVRVLPLGDG